MMMKVQIFVPDRKMQKLVPILTVVFGVLKKTFVLVANLVVYKKRRVADISPNSVA